jgi:WD40 repeat protein
MDLSQSDWEYVEERAGSFVGREWVFAQVRNFLSDPNGTFLLRGDPGTGKTAVAARLAQASTGHAQTPGFQSQPPVGEGTISAAVFCRAGKTAVPELIQQLSRQLAGSVDGFLAVLQSNLAPKVDIGEVNVKTGDVGAGANVTGVNIVLPSNDDEVAFNMGVAVPLKRLREAGATQSIVILVDAVDEAVAVDKVNTFSRLLGKLGGVHLIVTCRPDARVLTDFKAALHQVDLVRDAPTNNHDMRDYIRDRLQGKGMPNVIAELGDRVAGEAADNFLYAFYVTGTLVESGSLATMDENEVREASLPTGGLPGVYEDFLDRQIGGDEKKWETDLRPVLAPLCVALGDGFTTAQLGAVASQLSGVTFSRSKARDITRLMGQFLDGPRPDGPFRAYHQSFIQFLADPRQNPNWPIDTAEANNAVLEAFSGSVLEGGGTTKNWAAADPYAKKYLAAHAAASGRLDEFLMDAGYLLAAEPTRLLAALSGASAIAGRSAAGIIRRSAHQFQTCPREEAASYLEMQAHQSGLHVLAEEIARLSLLRPWAAPWAHWRRPQQRLRLAPDDDITAMTVGVLRGERVAVLATKAGQLQVRLITDGTNAIEPFMAHDSESGAMSITALATAKVDGHLVVLSGDRSGLIKAWNLEEKSSAHVYQPGYQPSYQGPILALAITDMNNERAVLSVAGYGVHAWRWSDQTKIGSYSFSKRFECVAIGRYEHGPMLAYADRDRVDFRVFAAHAPIMGGDAPWPSLWQYDMTINSSPQHYEDVSALAILHAADQTHVVSGDKKGYVWAWDRRYTEGGSEITPVGRHEHPLRGEWGSTVSAITIGNAGGREVAVSGDSDGKIKVWDLTESVQIDNLPTAHTSAIMALAVTDLDDGPVVVSLARDAARVWDISESGASEQPPVSALTFGSLDGTEVLLVGDDQGSIQVLRAIDGYPVAPTFRGHSGEVTAIAIAQAGEETVVLSAGADGTVQVWNPANATAWGEPFTAHGRVVTSVAVRQMDGRLIAASGGYDDTVRIWDVRSHALLGEPIRLSGTIPLGGAAFAELGRRPVVVTAASARRPSVAQIWDLSDRTAIGEPVTLSGSFGAVATIQLDAQPMIIFSDYDGVIRLRGFINRSHDADFHCSQAVWSRGLTAITINGAPVIIAGSHQNGVIDIWNVYSGTRRRIDIGSAILALATGPNRTLAVGTEDGVVLIRLLDALGI